MENPIRDFDINQPYTVEEIRGAIQSIKKEEKRLGSKATRSLKIIALIWVAITIALAVTDNTAGKTIVWSIIFFILASIPIMFALNDVASCNYTVDHFVFMNTQNEIGNIIPRGSSEKVISYAKQYAQIHKYVHQVSASGRDLLLMELSEFDKWVENEKVRVSYSEIVNC